MLTRIAPSFAVPYCTTAHSAQFGAQMPTRSPLRTPRSSRPSAQASTSATNCGYVQRRPVAHSTRASWSPTRAAVRSRFAPMVSPSSGTVEVPLAYDGSAGAVMAGSPPLDLARHQAGSVRLVGRVRVADLLHRQREAVVLAERGERARRLSGELGERRAAVHRLAPGGLDQVRFPLAEPGHVASVRRCTAR